MSLNKRGAFLFVGQFLCNFLYETPLGQIKENEMKKKKNAFPIMFAIMVLIIIVAKYLQ